jgi:uncharacterized membrane protein YdjX (TVP38/TMEM64 family)
MLHTLVPLFPAELIVLANSLLYGLWWGLLLSLVGAMLGAYLGFALVRFGGRGLLERLATKSLLKRFDHTSNRLGVTGWLLIRLTPVISFNLVNYAAGLSKMSWWTFSWTTALGILPVTTLITVTADQLSRGQRLGIWLLSILSLVATFFYFLKRKEQRVYDPN